MSDCDVVLMCVGRVPNTEGLGLAELGVKTDRKGYILADDRTRRTDNPKIYAGGDCIRNKGEASTVMAVQDGKLAARAICEQLVEGGLRKGTASAVS